MTMGRIAVKFIITRLGHVAIRGVINGHKVRLIVDTAAGTSVLDADDAEGFGLKVRRNSERDDVKGIGTSSEIMRRLIVPYLQLEKTKFPRPRFISLDLRHVKEAGGKRGMHGLLGSDFLKKYDAVIDYGERVLNLAIPDQ